ASGTDLRTQISPDIRSSDRSNAGPLVSGAKQRPVILTALATLVVALGLLTTSLIYRGVSRSGPSVRQSVAVLPFKPVNKDEPDLIYQFGIAESLILRLGAANGITVRPLSAVRKYS